MTFVALPWRVVVVLVFRFVPFCYNRKETVISHLKVVTLRPRARASQEVSDEFVKLTLYPPYYTIV